MGPKTTLVFSIFWIIFGRCVVSQEGKQCRDVAIPASKPRGVNQVGNNSTKPLFELELLTRDESGAFEVRIATGIQAYAFRDVTVAMTTNGTCGVGNLQYDSQDFTQTLRDESCPTVLATKRTTPMTSFPSLLWTPPTCGCVQFRVVLALAVENYYYTEAEGVSNGPLAKRVCVVDKLKELSREQRLDALCHVSEKHTSRSILSSTIFRKRHQLDSQYTDRLELEMALELRRSDARMCCSKVNEADKLTCFEDARYRRADRFCQDGFPDIPFVSFRSIFMRSKERRCCSILGVYRYLCFAKDSQLVAGSDVTPMDYSMDATDFANDLAEFATLEDYEEVLDKMFNKTTRRHDILLGKSKRHDDSTREEGKKDHGKKSESDTQDTVKTTYPRKIVGDEAINPRLTDAKSSMRHIEITRDPKSSTYTSKTPKPSPSTSSVQRTQTKREGGLSRSEVTPNSSEVYRRFPTYSKSRRTPQTSAERRKYRRITGGRSGVRQSLRRSGERKDQKRKHSRRRAYTRSSTFTSKDTGRGSRRLTSSERRYRGFKSFKKSREVLGGGMNVMEDIDNEGGASVEDTLNHLDRKMKRLELRRLCCEFGATSGRGVYGSLSVVMTECKHSSQKYLQRGEISFGIRKCRKQFVRCCMDEAKMGLTMSSAEFHNQALDRYLDNVGMTESVDHQDDVFLRHGLLQTRKKTVPNRSAARRDPTIQETLEAESDRRFDSMRAEAGDPRFAAEEWEGEEEEYEDKTGPVRFDEEDNRNGDNGIVFDDVADTRTLTDKKTPAVSYVKESGTKSSPNGVTDIEAEGEQDRAKVEDDNEGDEAREQMEEDFDNRKKRKGEGMGPGDVKEKGGEMIQIKRESHPDRSFSNSDKITQSNLTDGQMTPQRTSRTESQLGGNFQSQSKKSLKFNTTENILNNTQYRDKPNESIEPGTSEHRRQEVLHPGNETNNTNVEAPTLSTFENYLDNYDKRNTSHIKDEPETEIAEKMNPKTKPRPAQPRNKARVGSRLRSVHDNSLSTNNVRKQKFIDPPRQYYRRSRERSRFSSGRASRKSQRREGGSSRRRFRYSKRRRQQQHGLEDREKHVKAHKTKNRQVAMDSQEMANAHDKHLKLTALDSKEMAARYNPGREAMATFRHKDTLPIRTGGYSKRRRRHRKRNGQ